MSAAIDWLVVGGPVEPWTALGLVAEHDDAGGARIPLFGTGLAITGEGDRGMRRLAVSGVDVGTTDLDGVAVSVITPPSPTFADHPLGARSVDHVVIVTDDLVRTCGAIADATGAPLKRVREAGDVRQGFHRVGGLVVEVVERTGIEPGPAWLWGLVLVVDDLVAACDRLGPELIGEPRPAVQPGRQIATFRSGAGLGLPVALMTPHVG